MADLTYTQLVRTLTEFQTVAARSRDAIEARARKIDEIAMDTARVAESIAAMSVDTSTVSETRDLAKLLGGLSEDAISYAVAEDITVKNAGVAIDQARASHAGIKEQFGRAPVDLSGVNRDWLRQE
ncbi:hypothetical protein ACFVVP_33225 [Streptomyces sp. NPDC058128]|uniref:hypothetical protein n=1 Tax=Streptomyces sp. NPDC058128 TaxID=3346352 RepID=UPI0036E6A316